MKMQAKWRPEDRRDKARAALKRGALLNGMRSRFTLLMTSALVTALGAGLAACDQSSKRQARARVPEMAPPALAAPLPSNTPLDQRRGRQAKLLEPRPREAIEVLLESVGAAFKSGEESYKAGHLEEARRDFDRVVDWILMSGIRLDEDARLEALFNRVVETVHAHEAAAFREGDGFREPESEPAPIDEIAEMNLPVDPSLREAVERDVRAVPHDLPLVVNDVVLSYVNFFQTPRGRAIVEGGLTRAGRYRAMIGRVFREEGLPQDLIYLAQAESSFKPTALSRARARGMWQFMAPRAREYGLQVGWWVDERQDPEKATRAAAKHLRDLYEEFGDWHLVLAAYNTGPGNVARAIERTGFADFWELYNRNVLPRETKNHVPIILALAIVAKNQEKYGIRVQPEAPVETDVVKPGHPIDLRLVAETVDTSLETLKRLNPGLLRTVTPSDPEFELHLPAGTAERFFAEIAEIPQEKWVLWRRHRVEEGETLSGIAGKYRVTAAAIAQVNGIELRTVMNVGDRLTIPATTASTPSGQLVRYRVRRGDTLSDIARQHEVSVEELRRWNGIRGSTVARGAVLKVYPGGRPLAGSSRARRQKQDKDSPVGGAAAVAASVERGTDGSVTHRVKPGETLWSIARAYRTTVEALRSANQFLVSRQLKAGDLLVILVP